MLNKFKKIITTIYLKMIAMVKLNYKERKLIHSLINNKLTYLSFYRLINIAICIKKLRRDNANFDVLELGCALGGSSILISKLKSINTKFFVYDIFGLIPPPSEKDGLKEFQRYNSILNGNSVGIQGNKYYGYEKNLLQIVNDNFKLYSIDKEKSNIFLIKGLIQDSLVINQPVCFAHIDVDWYESVLFSLQKIWPKLIKNGIIIIDDYFDWSGCKSAVDYFLNDKDQEYKTYSIFGNLKLIKTV